MDIPADVLEELKCHVCNMYLCRGPVYLEHGGAAACGRCFSPKRPATRNKEYEAVAKLLRFPCKNRDLGCGETVGFEEVAHEARCSYRQYVCLVFGTSRCEWLGTRSQLLQHPDHVLDNPCSLTHDITKSSTHNYVLQTFQLLFLLHTKVCVKLGRIYHSVRLLNRDDMAQDFTYTLHIKRHKEEITKRRDVEPQGVLAIQEPTALGLDINSLLSVLGGWDGVSCTVTVERQQTDTESWQGQSTREGQSCYWRRQDTAAANCQEQENKNTEGIWAEPAYWQEQNTETEDWPSDETGATGWWNRDLRWDQTSLKSDRKVRQRHPETCVECGANVTSKHYRDDSGWRCEYCSPDRLTCKKRNKGCPHEDFPDKCKKHELYFCPQRTYCNICREPMPRGTLSAHYDTDHGHAVHSSGSTWRATRSRGSRYTLVTGPAGTALCVHRLSDSGFNLEVYIPVLSERLCEFRCEVHVTQPSTGLTRSYTPDVTYNQWWDWHVSVNQLEFPTWSHELHVIVEIS